MGTGMCHWNHHTKKRSCSIFHSGNTDEAMESSTGPLTDQLETVTFHMMKVKKDKTWGTVVIGAGYVDGNMVIFRAQKW